MHHLTGHLLASIPSPSSGTINIGPLKIHAYGLMIALGVVAAVWLLGRRFEEKGIGTRDDANSISVWAVIAGVIGARLYHVATDWSKFEHHLSNIPKIWQGGLGIPGGLLFGVPVGAYLIRKRGIPVARAIDCAAPAIALAQAIGRWGNYFNQELYGRATTLPWALKIDGDHSPDGRPGTFHPTFLYESLSNFALVAILLLIDRRRKVRPGHLMAIYLLGYGVIRFFVEGMRIDEAHHLGGLRWNQWVSIAAVIGAGAYLLLTRNRPQPVETAPIEPAADDVADGDSDDATDDDALDADADDEGVDAIDDIDDIDAEPLDQTDTETEIQEDVEETP